MHRHKLFLPSCSGFQRHKQILSRLTPVEIVKEKREHDGSRESILLYEGGDLPEVVLVCQLVVRLVKVQVVHHALGVRLLRIDHFGEEFIFT